jgi:hypothetical protein
MNWKAIQRAWESGDRDIAVRLLGSMVEEMRFRQKSLSTFIDKNGTGNNKGGSKNINGCSDRAYET